MNVPIILIPRLMAKMRTLPRGPPKGIVHADCRPRSLATSAGFVVMVIALLPPRTERAARSTSELSTTISSPSFASTKKPASSWRQPSCRFARKTHRAIVFLLAELSTIVLIAEEGAFLSNSVHRRVDLNIVDVVLRILEVNILHFGNLTAGTGIFAIHLADG